MERKILALLPKILGQIPKSLASHVACLWITTFAGVTIFVGLTAYDTQKTKNRNIIGNDGTDEDKKEAIAGALILYLDFINLFILIWKTYTCCLSIHQDLLIEFSISFIKLVTII